MPTAEVGDLTPDLIDDGMDGVVGGAVLDDTSDSSSLIDDGMDGVVGADTDPDPEPDPTNPGRDGGHPPGEPLPPVPVGPAGPG